jgi:UDP-N-acetylmuramoylalanine--D-glutamate ligase
MSSITSPAQPQPNDFQENYLIVGLGRSGLSSAKYLAKYENTFGKTINISTYDKFKNINEQKKILKGLNVKNFYTGDIQAEYCPKGSYIVLSPGIDFNEIEEITQGNKVVNDIFLFLKYIEKKHNATRNLKIIGVTGTNGKTTTCSFLEHLYNKLGINVKLAGNIGLSPLDLIDELDNVEIIILEISSFQLMPFIEKALPVKLDVF